MSYQCILYQNSLEYITIVSTAISSLAAVVNILIVVYFFNKTRKTHVHDESIAVKLTWFRYVFDEYGFDGIYKKISLLNESLNKYLNQSVKDSKPSLDNFIRDWKKKLRDLPLNYFNKIYFIDNDLSEELTNKVDILEEEIIPLFYSGLTESEIKFQSSLIIEDFRDELLGRLLNWEQEMVVKKISN